MRWVVALASAPLVAASLLVVPASLVAPPARADTPPASMVTESAAAAAAQKWDKPVVVSSLTSSRRQVRALPDGNLEATLNARPVRALKDGAWADIDTRLRKRPDGGLEPVVAPVGLVFSGGGDGPFVRMTRANRQLALTWPHGPLPAPSVQGDTATYAEVLKDVDLVVRATDMGFTHVLKVKTPEAARLPAVTRLELELDAAQMKVSADPDGGLKAVDEAIGGTVFRAAQPIMWDSSGTQASPAPTPETGRTSGTGTAATPSRPAATPSAGALPTATPRAQATAATDPITEDLSEGPAETSRRADIKATPQGGKLVLEPDTSLFTAPGTTFPVYLDPDWQSPGESKSVMVGTRYSDASWEDEGMGLCDDSDPYMGGQCGGSHVKRLFFGFVLPASVKNTKIVKAEFKPYQTGAYNCTAAEAEVWKTKGVGGTTRWSTQAASGFWQRKLVERSFNYGNEGVGCANSTVVLQDARLLDEVQKTANGSGSLWLGMKAGSENSTRYWKRFNNDAVLRILYNLPPKVPSNVQMVAEGANYPCRDRSASMPYLRAWPRLSAKITDPQGSDRVQAEYLIGWGDANGAGFQWRIGGPSLGPDAQPLYSAGGNSGSTFTKEVGPLATSRGIPKNVPIAWAVRGHDFKDGLENDNPANWFSSGYFSGTSTANGGLGHYCWFVYDDAAPKPPTVTSVKYPADGAEHDAVDVPGDFTVTAAPGEPISKFGIQFTPPGKPAETIEWKNLGTTPSAGCDASKCTFTKTPHLKGEWRLDVIAVDRAGRSGSSAPYTFRVGQLPTEEAHWRLDEPSGAKEVKDEIATDLYQAISFYSGKCLNVEQGSNANGAHVVQWDCAGVDWERWKFTHQGGDVYSISSKRSGKCLDVEGSPPSTANGAHVIQATCASTPSQSWKRIKLASGFYQLASQHSNKCLNIANAAEGDALNNGAHLTLWDCHDIAWRKWQLLSVNEAKIVGDDAALGVRARVGSDALKLNFDGNAATTGFAETQLPVVDPSKSFSVSAWAKLNNASGTATIAAQDGSTNSSFFLQYAGGNQRWSMSSVTGDTAGAAGVRALSSEAPKIGQWTHLVGVYDATTKTLKLYVDGRPQGTTAHNGDAWSSPKRQAFSIGRAKYNGANTHFFPGEIDDVRVFDRAVTADDAQRWYRSTVQATWKLNAPAGTNTVVPDDSGAGNGLSLKGGAQIKPDDDEVCDQFTGGCLALDGKRADGTGAWAQTAGPLVDTSGSFTVAGWADIGADQPTRAMTLFAMAGAKQSAFTVRFNPEAAPNPYYDPDRDPPSARFRAAWELETADKDTDGASVVRSTVYQSQDCNICIGEGPDHLMLSYDAVNKIMRLYVNGRLDGTENSSFKGGVTGFKASGPLLIGRRLADGQTADSHLTREYFAGVLDNVWVYKGALSNDEDLARLANLEELDSFAGNPQLPETYD
ncbi:LamG-like jellyroll fold domain-containing protein [Actinomadura flavalba]|uniref:LamG-like jellyroll fold domain-containing protein n=1 Tax=Actinomadura flavalba TaxID=1120938 RepID=UPI0003A77590|nr:LamG-like jellyroll fold domain-containing protein [Actinomadura flavalba]